MHKPTFPNSLTIKVNPCFLCLMGKAMATYSSTLAWEIPGTEEPGGLPSMGLHRFRHD